MTHYAVYKGSIEIGPVHPIAAFFYDQSGAVVFLERLPGGRR